MHAARRPFAFGTPPDRASAIGVLKAAVAADVDHIDTAQYYGPSVVNELILAKRSTPSDWPCPRHARAAFAHGSM